MTIFFDFTEASIFPFFWWIAVLTLPPGLVFLSVAWWRWFVAWGVADWTRTDGILEAVERMPDGAVSVMCGYIIAGQKFTQQSRYRAKDTLPVVLSGPQGGELVPGARVAVLYDPARPARSRMALVPPSFPYLHFALGGSLTFFGMVALVCVAYLHWSKSS
ncbi:hypothetical protein DB346_02055 [Verrucomicrobia bacterium LW23]|nr:hypothetical protein DB346_02055 [Verrucomicrobia bacterium LW23]